MNRMRLILTLSFVLAMVLLVPRSRAAEDGEPMTALELVQAGQAAYLQRDYVMARTHFETFSPTTASLKKPRKRFGRCDRSLPSA